MPHNAPYPEQDFQVRLELGIARQDQPSLLTKIDRIMVSINGTWQGLTTPLEAVNIAPSRNGCWTSIWQGNLNPGTLDGLTVMLDETAFLLARGDRQQVTLPAAVRELKATPNCPTNHTYPVVVTLLIEAKPAGSEARVALKSVMVREIDTTGMPNPLGTSGD